MLNWSIIKPGMKVRISNECPKTKIVHGLNHLKKKQMMGLVHTVDRVRDETTIVIDRWHFHPDDLFHESYIFECEIAEKEKPDYNPVYFKVEDL